MSDAFNTRYGSAACSASSTDGLIQKSSVLVCARLTCSISDRARLEQWARTATAPHRLVLRSRIVLLLLDGHSQVSAARVLGIARETVSRWERRFLAGGAEALLRDRPGRGRRPGRNASHVARVLAAVAEAPEGGWTIRRLAAHVGVSAATVQRIRRDHAHAIQARLTGHALSRPASQQDGGPGKAIAFASVDASA